MQPVLGEFIGTMILLILGNGVNANVSLRKTYGEKSGWLVICLGWGLAVFVAVFIAGSSSGAHLNPAVTVGLAIIGKFPWLDTPAYILAQIAGAFTGAWLVYLQYRPHFSVTEDAATKLGLFSTSPAIKSIPNNLLSEVIGSFVLVFAIFHLVSGSGLGSLSALPVALLVVSIGLSLGGTTGYAINPARDLGPRIFHMIAPMKAKGSSNWKYAWIPLAGPIIGSVIASILFLLVQA